MKGIVFTEFLDYVTATHGPDCVDDMIEASGVPHDGAYTSVGTYDFKEMQALVVALSRSKHQSASELLRDFGSFLCNRLIVYFPHFFAEHTTLFDFIARVDDHVHVEVCKLYPDAELPKFRVNNRDRDQLELDYTSCRPLEALAEGMILAAASHYMQPIKMDTVRMGQTNEPFVRFTIRYAEAA